MNVVRLKLGGTLRNVHLTSCRQWTCPTQYTPNFSSGLFHCDPRAEAGLSVSHRNIYTAVSLAVCREPKVKSQLGTTEHHHPQCLQMHHAVDYTVNYDPSHYAGNNSCHCNSQTRLSRDRLSFSSFSQRDCVGVRSALRTFSTQSRAPFLKGRCMHSTQTRSYFEGVYASLAQSAPVQSTQGLLLELHQWSGLPWWAVICLSTFAIRTLVVLPLAIHQMQVISRLAKIDAEIRGLVPELNKEVAIARRLYGFDELHARRVFRKQLRSIRQKFIVRDNCHPFKAVLLVFFQMPLWVCLSISLRNLTFMAQRGSSGALDLKSEGLLWFPDLTVPDPFLIPLILLALNLALTHVHVLRQKGSRSTLQKVMINGSRVISVVVAAAATINPSSVSFYWVCSSAFGLGQNILLASPRIKSVLGIHSLTTKNATPVDNVKNQPPKE